MANSVSSGTSGATGESQVTESLVGGSSSDNDQTTAHAFTTGTTTEEALSGVSSRSQALEERSNWLSSGGFGAAGTAAAMPSFANVTYGSHGTTANSALLILNDVAAGKAPFNPAVGQRGLVQWFVTEGNPRTGRTAPDVKIPAIVEVPRGVNVLEFNDATLIEIHEKVYEDAVELVTHQYSERYPNRSLTSVGSLKEIRFQAAGRAEGNMWRVVGERVAESDGGVGRVVQSAESPFSVGRPGTFMIAANPDLVTINGGPAKLLEIIKSEGIPAEPEVLEAVQQKAQSAKIVGNVEHVFRVGGRLLVITGVAVDATNIYMADDRVREVVKVTGGWGGAAAAVTAYNAVMAPTNSAGPTAWLGNALANIAVGFGGYYGGSQISSVIYDVTIDPIPVSVSVE